LGVNDAQLSRYYDRTAAKINPFDLLDVHVRFLEARRNGSLSPRVFQLYRDRTELRGPNVLSYVNIQLNFPGARIRASAQVELETVSN